MITKVTARRTVIPGKEKDFFSLIRQLRFFAMEQSGYISGETLIGARHTNQVLVISKWTSLDHWNKWQESDPKKQIENQLLDLQEEPAVFEPYVFSKFKAAADLGFPPPLQKMKL